jgi:serine/threonine protein kinase
MAATVSVKEMCNLMAKNRLLPSDEIRAAYQKWTGEAANPDDAEAFRRYLVTRGLATDYQASLLAHGRTEGYYIDEYKILDRAGQGRMAGVYRAVTSRNEPVALKVLPPSKAKKPDLLARFQRESKMATQLRHPNVVRTYDVGTYGDDQLIYFMVMEYLEGETLEDVLKRRNKLPVGEAVTVIHQALLGLQHIHERGMIHRDLKPANLMLIGPKDNLLKATVKILDIGLGRETFDEGGFTAAPDQQLTGEGVLLGTPDYLAPEQARDARSADIRADIYSLGCVLYHALSGQPPFPDKNVLNQMIRHAKEEAAPLHQFNDQVPDGLQQIVNFMIAKDAANRYPTPERAARALQLFLPTDAAPEPVAPAKKEAKPAKPPAELPVGKIVSEPKKAEKPKPPAVPEPKVPAAATPTTPAAAEVKPSAPAPATPVATTPPASVGEYDVELVAIPVPPPKGKLPGTKRTLFDLDRRDFIMLAAGAGGAVAAILSAMGLAKLVR